MPRVLFIIVPFVVMFGVVSVSHATTADQNVVSTKVFEALSAKHCSWVQEKSIHDYSEWGGFVLTLGWDEPHPDSHFVVTFLMERGSGADAGNEIDWGNAVTWNAQVIHHASKFIGDDQTRFFVVFHTETWSVTSFGMDPQVKSRWLGYEVIGCPPDVAP